MWKLGSIIPLYKGKGPKTDPKNYSPITITCSLCRIYEKVLLNFMKPSLNTLISKYQHGFFEKRSTFNNLIQFYNFVITKLDERKSIDIASFDMSKAFDKLDHCILLNKMRKFGFHEGLINTIKNFLTNRFQQVIVFGVISPPSSVSSGVPQELS